jgi:DNA end-binding protein Ku
VRVRKFCEVEDREVRTDEIGKGYQLTREQVISDDELCDLPLPTAEAIEIEAFVPLESVDPIRIGEGYYLQPSGQVAAKPYKLLRMALAQSSKVAAAKYAWSGRERPTRCGSVTATSGRTGSPSHTDTRTGRREQERR